MRAKCYAGFEPAKLVFKTSFIPNEVTLLYATNLEEGRGVDPQAALHGSTCFQDKVAQPVQITFQLENRILF